MPSTNVAAKATVVGALKRKSIFRKDCQKLDAAFIEAGLPEKVLLVPLDFAKSTHYACFCDGLVRYLRQACTVKNNKEGLDYLVERIEATRKSRAIRSKHLVLVGGEDSASYTRNFMIRLSELGYLAVRLNAYAGIVRKVKQTKRPHDLITGANLCIIKKPTHAGRTRILVPFANI